MTPAEIRKLAEDAGFNVKQWGIVTGRPADIADMVPFIEAALLRVQKETMEACEKAWAPGLKEANRLRRRVGLEEKP